jgi:hypothetical protein
MANCKEHAIECFIILGEEYLVVHKFLDQYVGVFPVEKHSDLHRIFLHNKNGLYLCKLYYGEEGEKAAKVHLVRDWFCISIKEKDFTWIEKNLEKALIYFEQLADSYGRRRDYFNLEKEEKRNERMSMHKLSSTGML